MQPAGDFKYLNTFYGTNFSSEKPILEFLEGGRLSYPHVKAERLGKLPPETILAKLEINQFLLQRVRAKILGTPEGKTMNAEQLGNLAPVLLQGAQETLEKLEMEAQKIASFTIMKIQKNPNLKDPKEITAQIVVLASALESHIKTNIQPKIEQVKREVIPITNKESNAVPAASGSLSPRAAKEGWGEWILSPRSREGWFNSVKRAGQLFGRTGTVSPEPEEDLEEATPTKEEQPLRPIVFSTQDFRTIAIQKNVTSRSKYLQEKLAPMTQQFASDNANGSDFMRCVMAPDRFKVIDSEGKDIFEGFVIDNTKIPEEKKTADLIQFEEVAQRMQRALLKFLQQTYPDSTTKNGISPQANAILDIFEKMINDVRKIKTRSDSSSAEVMKKLYLCLKAGALHPLPLNETQSKEVNDPEYTDLRKAVGELPDRGFNIATLINLCVNQNIVNTASVTPSETLQGYVRAVSEANESTEITHEHYDRSE